MNQSTNDQSHAVPPPMTNYIPQSVPPMTMSYQQPLSIPSGPPQYPPQHAVAQPSTATPLEQPSNIHYPPTASNSSDNQVAANNFAAQQQQMAAMMQMQQPWGMPGGYPPNPYMMPYPMGSMVMMPPQAGMDRPASRQSSRPPSRQSITAPVSSSRSLVNGQTGGQNQAAAAATASAMLPGQGYPGYLPPGMYNPWFDPYWQSLYAGYQNPYSFGYNDEMTKYWRQAGQVDDDRASHHSAAYSQSKQSQHSSSMIGWGSMDSLNDAYLQNHNATFNGYYPSKQPSNVNQAKQPNKQITNPSTLLTTAPPVSSQQPIPSTVTKRQDVRAPENGAAEEEEEEESDEEEEGDDDDEENASEESDEGSSDRFSIKSDLEKVQDESSKGRRTPLLYIRPHLRARFFFNQLTQVLPQSPSDTNQPATVEILSADNLRSMAPILGEERQLLENFLGPLTASTARSNVVRYCEHQSQSAQKSLHIIDRDALSLLWQYMALLVKTNGVIDVRVDIPKILWSSSTAPMVADESATNSNHPSTSSTTLETSLREFLALGEIETSIKFACENQLLTHALIISYLTDKNLFEKTMHNIIANLDNGDVLKTFYELGAGSTPSVILNVTKPHYGDWKRHLAVILAHRTDTNAQFVDLCVKTMGDTLVSSGRIYAGHFCYLIANIPFGSYRNNADKLAVLGSIHAGHTDLSFASIPNLQLTEVYEFAVKKCLTSFIPLKIYYTSKLVLHGLKREALAYCEEIGNTLIRQGNASYVQLVDLQLFIMLAEKSRAFNRNFQLDRSTYKEPTWLIELRRIIQSLLDNAFLNKTVRDESFNTSYQQPTQPAIKTEQNKSHPPNDLPTVTEKQSGRTARQAEVQPAPLSTTAAPSLVHTNTNIANGYDRTNQMTAEQVSYQNPIPASTQNNLTVDTAAHYQSSFPPNFYQPLPPSQQQQQNQYYPTDSQATETIHSSQQWNQQANTSSQPEQLNQLSQIPSFNNSYLHPSGDQPQYIQPGFTSTPNPYSPPKQSWQSSDQMASRDRLPSNENQPPPISEEQPTPVKKKHPLFDDDDVFPTNSQKSSEAKSNSTSPAGAANQTGAGGQKIGFVGKIMTTFGLKRPTQAHLPDDKQRAIKFDEKTGRWIDTTKSSEDQVGTVVKPPPIMPSIKQTSSTMNNVQPPPPSMPPAPSQQPQPRTLSFASGSTTTAPTNAIAPQTEPPAWSPQVNTGPASTTTQQQPPPQKAPTQLSAAQLRLQASRQQQAATAAAMQQPSTASSSNQYSLRNRPTQSRYVDVLASTNTAVAPNPTIPLNNLIPTPSAGMPTYASSNSANNFLVPNIRLANDSTDAEVSWINSNVQYNQQPAATINHHHPDQQH